MVRKKGIPEVFFSSVMPQHNGARTSVDSELSEVFVVTVGVQQGSVL